MKAITLHQPWASLIAYGAKKIETRSWRTKHRGLIAIHASTDRGGVRTLNRLLKMGGSPHSVMWAETIAQALQKLGMNGDVPHGCIVAFAELVDCVEMTPDYIASVNAREKAFGIYEVHRFAWLLENVRRCDEHIRATGARRMWEWGGL